MHKICKKSNLFKIKNFAFILATIINIEVAKTNISFMIFYGDTYLFNDLSYNKYNT